MDPDTVQLRIAGKFIPATSRSGGLADDASTSQSTSGTSLAAYSTYAEGVAADECPTFTGGD